MMKNELTNNLNILGMLMEHVIVVKLNDTLIATVNRYYNRAINSYILEEPTKINNLSSNVCKCAIFCFCIVVSNYSLLFVAPRDEGVTE